MQNSADHDALLSLEQVLKLVGISQNTWRRGLVAGVYPAPVWISQKIRRWRLTDIQDFLKNGIAKTN